MVARDEECKDAQRRWIVGKLVNEAITSDVQALVVESDQEVRVDQEASIADVKNTLAGELRSVGGSSSVSKTVTGGCKCGERCDGQERAGDAEHRVSGCTVTWTVKIAGHVVSRSLSSPPDVRTAYERRRRRSCRKALVQFNELLRLLIRQPEDKGENQNCIGIVLDLVDRSDELVVGTTGRVVKAHCLSRARGAAVTTDFSRDR